jgi:hypothetical protein
VFVPTAGHGSARRRKKPPDYGDRVYDTLRAEPNAVERRLFAKAWQRRPLMMREAARIVARGPMGEQRNIVEVRAARGVAGLAGSGGSGGAGSRPGPVAALHSSASAADAAALARP